MPAHIRPRPSQQPPESGHSASTPVVRLWAHGRFGYQDVVLLLFPIVGFVLVALSLIVLPAYFQNAPRQAGTATVSACEYFEEGERFKCTGSFEPDAGTTLTPPPHIWVGEGDLPVVGESQRAELFADDTLRLDDEDAVDPFLALGLILSAVGLPIAIIYLRNLGRYRMSRRRNPGADVIDRRGWPSAAGTTAASRDVLRSRAVTNRRASAVLLGLVALATAGVGGVMIADVFAPGRVAASVTVVGCGDSGDLSGQGMRPLVTCTATADDGAVMDFHPQTRRYLDAGARIDGQVAEGRFIDRSGGIAAEPLFPALVALVVGGILIGLVVRANGLELRRLRAIEDREVR